MDKAIGLLELSSVASGYAALDTMLKTAPVEVLLARTICSGKYLVLVAGDVGSVRAAVAAGSNREPTAVIAAETIAAVHEQVLPALGGSVVPQLRGALGVVECFSVATAIRAADAACKAADVNLLELRAAMALGGKGYFTVTGSPGAVRAAVDEASALAADEGLLVNAVVLTGPHPDLLAEVI